MTTTATGEPICSFDVPSEADLLSIESEWTLIAAEVAVVDAECAHALQPSPLTARRLTHAVDQLIQTLLEACANLHTDQALAHPKGA